jgi:hypothetical protein
MKSDKIRLTAENASMFSQVILVFGHALLRDGKLTTFLGSVFTKDLSRALRVSSKIRAGKITVGVNFALMVGP